MLEASGQVLLMRDATSIAAAAVLNELASASKVGIGDLTRRDSAHQAVQAGCDLLGYDPLYVANEGKLVAVVAAEDAKRVVAVMCRLATARRPSSSAG